MKGQNDQRHLTFLSFTALLLCAIIVAPEEEAWGDSERHAAAVSAGNASSRPRPLRTIVDIPLPGTTHRFDYQSYDPSRHRLFIAHLGDSTVIVFDTASRSVVKVIPGIDQVHGVLVEPALGRVFATATGQNRVAIIDEESLRVMTRIPGGVYPDGLAYAPSAHKLYVSDETGQTETVIDVDTNRRVSSIPLGGEAGNSQYDAVSEHVLVNVQSRNELVAIDPARDVIDHRYPLPGCNTNHGLHLDPVVHLAYIACTGNDRLLVLDLDSLRVLQRHAVGRDPDVMDFDPGLRILYVASESGNVSLFRRESRALVNLGDVRVAPHAHSIVVDPQTHLVFLPLQDINGSPALRVMAPSGAQ